MQNVVKDSKKGRNRSRKILDVLDPSAQQYLDKHKKESPSATNLIPVSPIKNSEERDEKEDSEDNKKGK